MTRRTILFPLLLTALFLLVGASGAHAQDGDHRAGLVIRYADGSVQTQCVAFSEPSITGEELLQRSGLAVTLDYNAGLGGAVCSINNQGCAYPIKDCFCKCTGIQCEYWAYYHRTAVGWQYASSGASSFLVNDGALEGWSWGAGNWSSGVEPPIVAFSEVCAPPATATPTATVTATPTGTATATPTATVQPLQDQTPPQVTFEAQPPELTPGACATLRWWVSDATQLTLDGTPVNAQEQRQILPAYHAALHPGRRQCGRPDGTRDHRESVRHLAHPDDRSAGIICDPHSHRQRGRDAVSHAESRRGEDLDSHAGLADRGAPPGVGHANGALS